MNFTKIIVLIFALLVTSICSSQSKIIDNIVFSYSSAKRIPFNNVNIKIYKRANGKSAFAYVTSEPLIDEKKWQYSKIDTLYDIDIEKFNHLAKKVFLLEKMDLDKAHEAGADGNTCKIEFGAKGRNTSYSFWIPKSDTSKRGLDVFVELCEELITLVKLDPKEILEK